MLDSASAAPRSGRARCYRNSVTARRRLPNVPQRLLGSRPTYRRPRRALDRAAIPDPTHLRRERRLDRARNLTPPREIRWRAIGVRAAPGAAADRRPPLGARCGSRVGRGDAAATRRVPSEPRPPPTGAVRGRGGVRAGRERPGARPRDGHAHGHRPTARGPEGLRVRGRVRPGAPLPRPGLLRAQRHAGRRRGGNQARASAANRTCSARSCPTRSSPPRRSPTSWSSPPPRHPRAGPTRSADASGTPSWTATRRSRPRTRAAPAPGCSCAGPCARQAGAGLRRARPAGGLRPGGAGGRARGDRTRRAGERRRRPGGEPRRGDHLQRRPGTAWPAGWRPTTARSA